MNESEIKQLWQKANEKAELNLAISHKNSNDIKLMKVRSLLHSMKPFKFIALLIGICWVVVGTNFLLRIYLTNFAEANKFFLISATIQILITTIALFIYIYQLVAIYETDIFGPIIKTQRRLSQIRISTLWSVRILVLQLPIWSVFWWNETMLQKWNIWQWVIALSSTVLLTFAAIWLFLNIKYENKNKKWFQLIFSGKEWSALTKSIELLGQIEDYR